jgi:outer membrane protein assembly factor BamB
LIVGIEKSGGFMIRSYDLETNEIIWENNNMPSSNFWPKRISNIHCKDNILALSSGPRILVLNMDNGKEIWRIELNNGDTWSVLIGDWIYKSDYNKQLETLYRYNLMTGTREKVLELGLVDGYSPGIMMPVKWTSPAGDEILVLQNRTFNWAGVG